LAYAVVVKAQPTPPIGNGIAGQINPTELTQVATTVFQRGEAFQPGSAQPEAGGGAVVPWTGQLTIAGRTQDVSGSILVRPNPRNLLLLIVTATESARSQVPEALAALANTLQAI
jgi:hypothetical protein